MSRIESHYSSTGVPDVSYCYGGTEGWIELKAGPDLDVRATQVLWMEDRVLSGGRPFFLIEWLGDFHIVPGSRASDIRKDGSRESILRATTVMWEGEIPPDELASILRNPNDIFE